MLSALGFAEQNEESPWDSESNSESLPETYVHHLSGHADQKGASTLNQQVEGFCETTSRRTGQYPKETIYVRGFTGGDITLSYEFRR
ncbi:ankyrin repeat domain-containing protein 26-like [Mustela lutreola]|uniref:ankyrin repeat domain-containing protein 26-like n=1 Tax=Mustela lutreola TaxID=9666 RepID=UPI0027973522|nr:ankyrin repeat domain-containing protein 26-like [Mustela lutreola]